jgi:hypothetical protein
MRALNTFLVVTHPLTIAASLVGLACVPLLVALALAAPFLALAFAISLTPYALAKAAWDALPARKRTLPVALVEFPQAEEETLPTFDPVPLEVVDTAAALFYMDGNITLEEALATARPLIMAQIEDGKGEIIPEPEFMPGAARRTEPQQDEVSPPSVGTGPAEQDNNAIPCGSPSFDPAALPVPHPLYEQANRSEDREERIQKAVQLVLTGEEGVRAAARLWGVPESTVRGRVKKARAG